MYRHIPHRVEYEDLFQMAVLAVLRVMDQALEKYEDPYSYIFLAVQRELAEYCLWRSHLIRMPETRDEHGGALYEPYEMVDVDCAIEEAGPLDEQDRDYATLYEAVEKLSGRYKTVIEMRFGLSGHAPTSLWNVSNAITDGKSKTAAGPYQSQALRKLHKYLEKGA
jgi:DNA-directed RNA polymerase specialized sigma subunit